jgi:hypothetical protein
LSPPLAEQGGDERGGWDRIGFVTGAGTSNVPHEYSYDDKNLAAGRYAYRLKQIDRSGSFSYSGAVEVEVGIAPREFTLSQNYPNPFNPSTRISFTVEMRQVASLQVYNTLGQLVVTLFEGDAEAGMFYERTFDASRLPTGVYFARLESGEKQLLMKMLLVK